MFHVPKAGFIPALGRSCSDEINSHRVAFATAELATATINPEAGAITATIHNVA